MFVFVLLLILYALVKVLTLKVLCERTVAMRNLEHDVREHIRKHDVEK